MHKDRKVLFLNINSNHPIMKKLLMIVACASFMTAAATAQTSGSTDTKATKSTKSSAMYYCPKCMASSDKPGTCAKCNAKMVKKGDYYCPGCGATSSKPGKCAKCNMDMKQMTGKA
jgi:hypothetical protein